MQQYSSKADYVIVKMIYYRKFAVPSILYINWDLYCLPVIKGQKKNAAEMSITNYYLKNCYI